MCVYMGSVQLLSRVQLFATPWTAAYVYTIHSLVYTYTYLLVLSAGKAKKQVYPSSNEHS